MASQAINGIYDGVSTKELDDLLIQTSAMLIAEEPEYSKLAARLLTNYIDKEVDLKGSTAFSESITYGYKNGLISKELYEFTIKNSEKLNTNIQEEKCQLFDYFGLRTLYDRYLLKDPKARTVIESPQFFSCELLLDLQKLLKRLLPFIT